MSSFCHYIYHDCQCFVFRIYMGLPDSPICYNPTIQSCHSWSTVSISSIFWLRSGLEGSYNSSVVRSQRGCCTISFTVSKGKFDISLQIQTERMKLNLPHTLILLFLYVFIIDTMISFSSLLRPYSEQATAHVTLVLKLERWQFQNILPNIRFKTRI